MYSILQCLLVFWNVFTILYIIIHKLLLSVNFINIIVTWCSYGITYNDLIISFYSCLTMSKLDDIDESHQAITGVVQLWYETNKRHPYAWNILLIIIRLPAVRKWIWFCWPIRTTYSCWQNKRICYLWATIISTMMIVVSVIFLKRTNYCITNCKHNLATVYIVTILYILWLM